MNLQLYAMPGNEERAQALARALHGRCEVELAGCVLHRFPDGETLVRVQAPRPDAQAVLLCSLDDADSRTVPLLMAADTLRELGAARVGLVAPYLAYMRQDRRFAPGQAVSARLYAQLLSAHFDWLLTVDPHLHRIRNLADVYSTRCVVLHAAPRLADWIRTHVERPLIIGPDGESAQWGADVAERAAAPVVVVDKRRDGDRDVHATIPDLQPYRDRQPVLLDDIISTGRTLVASLEHLRAAGQPAAACVVVHGLFAGDALTALRAAGATRIACADTTEAVAGVERIALDSDLADALLALAAEDGGRR